MLFCVWLVMLAALFEDFVISQTGLAFPSVYKRYSNNSTISTKCASCALRARVHPFLVRWPLLGRLHCIWNAVSTHKSHAQITRTNHTQNIVETMSLVVTKRCTHAQRRQVLATAHTALLPFDLHVCIRCIPTLTVLKYGTYASHSLSHPPLIINRQ